MGIQHVEFKLYKVEDGEATEVSREEAELIQESRYYSINVVVADARTKNTAILLAQMHDNDFAYLDMDGKLSEVEIFGRDDFPPEV